MKMFKNMEPLDSEKHAKLKYKPLKGFAFASKLPLSLLGGSEVAEASKSFPVVFPEKDAKNVPMLPMALFSFKLDENPFVGENGQWKADYIPAHIRRYPFMFAPIPEKENQFAVMIDKDAPQFDEDQGQPLFDENKKPKNVVIQAQTFLTQFQQDLDRTVQTVSLLEAHDVLVSKQFKITRGDKASNVRGFRVVDTEKLAKLDDAVLALWVRNGLMGIIFAHLHSLNNIRRITQLQGVEEKDTANRTS
jgi:hypothetical protein